MDDLGRPAMSGYDLRGCCAVPSRPPPKVRIDAGRVKSRSASNPGPRQIHCSGGVFVVAWLVSRRRRAPPVSGRRDGRSSGSRDSTQTPSPGDTEVSPASGSRVRQDRLERPTATVDRPRAAGVRERPPADRSRGASSRTWWAGPNRPVCGTSTSIRRPIASSCSAISPGNSTRWPVAWAISQPWTSCSVIRRRMRAVPGAGPIGPERPGREHRALQRPHATTPRRIGTHRQGRRPGDRRLCPEVPGRSGSRRRPGCR